MLDARGHGDSDWHPDQEYSLDGLVGDVLKYIATLDRPPIIVGASLGGMTALLAAGEHPDTARGIVLAMSSSTSSPRASLAFMSS